VPQKNLPRILLLVKWTERAGAKKFWNFAEMRARPPIARQQRRDVRFAPKADKLAEVSLSLLCAKRDICGAAKKGYLTTSSACQKRTHAPRLRFRALVLQLFDFSALSLFSSSHGVDHFEGHFEEFVPVFSSPHFA
jgi:hypothetical protein